MDTPEYPARKCREAVFNTHGMAYACELKNLHLGPCMSLSILDSRAARQGWEDRNPDSATGSHPSEDILL